MYNTNLQGKCSPDVLKKVKDPDSGNTAFESDIRTAGGTGEAVSITWMAKMPSLAPTNQCCGAGAARGRNFWLEPEPEY